MAATIVYNTARFDADGGSPIIHESPSGLSGDCLTYEVLAAQMSEAGDFSGILAVPEGRRLLALAFTHEDMDGHATPTLDADIVLRTLDSAGTATDTVLVNYSTGFTAAVTTPVVTLLGSTIVPSSALGYGYIGFKVVAAAATAAAGDVNLLVLWR